MELLEKTFNSEDKAVGTQNDCLEKVTPVCEGIFHIWMLGMELWNKTFNFEDNIGLLVLKIIV